MESFPTTEPRPEGLHDQVRALREQHATHLRVQLALVLAVGAFVWRSAVIQHRSLEEVRMMSARIQQDVVRQQTIVAELQKIAVNRPKFAELLQQHGIGPATPAPVSNPPAGRP